MNSSFRVPHVFHCVLGISGNRNRFVQLQHHAVRAYHQVDGSLDQRACGVGIMAMSS